MKYNGMKVEIITEGYWPDGVELICSDDGVDWHKRRVVCLHNGVGFLANGEASLQWACWAIIPPKLPPRMLTNREALGLCRKGWDVYNELVGTTFWYPKDADDIAIAIDDGIRLRAPGSDKWVEPTSDLLEV